MLKRLTTWLNDLLARRTGAASHDDQEAPAYSDEDAQAWAQLLISADALGAPPPLPPAAAPDGGGAHDWNDLVDRARAQALNAGQPVRRTDPALAVN